MIRSVTVTNYLGDSKVLELANPEPSGFVITSIEGLGPVKSNINTTDLASNDGALYNSARLETRNIVFNIVFLEHSTIEETRQLTYKYFPIKKPVTLVFKVDNREAMTLGYVESNEPTIFSEREGCQISIICPDPYFYSTGEGGTTVTVFSGVQPNFQFPWSNESLEIPLIEMGIIENLKERTIYYTGDSETGVVIQIHAIGRADNITIYNTGTRETFTIDTDRLQALTGYGIVAGDDIEISTLRGKKRITLLRNGIQTNILNCIDKNSSWFQLAKGDNVFTYIATYGSSNLQFKIISQIVYEGV